MTLELTPREIRMIREVLAITADRWYDTNKNLSKEIDDIRKKIWNQINGLDWIPHEK